MQKMEDCALSIIIPARAADRLEWLYSSREL